MTQEEIDQQRGSGITTTGTMVGVPRRNVEEVSPLVISVYNFGYNLRQLFKNIYISKK